MTPLLQTHADTRCPTRHSSQIDRLLFIILFILLFNAKYYNKKRNGSKLWEQNVFFETKDFEQQQMCDKWCEISRTKLRHFFVLSLNLFGTVDDLISIRIQMIVSSLFRLALVRDQNMRINNHGQ